MRCSTLLTIFTGVLLYLVLGAVVFRALEVPHEEDQYVKLQITRQEYLDNYTCITPEVLQALIEVRRKKDILQPSPSDYIFTLS